MSETRAQPDLSRGGYSSLLDADGKIRQSKGFNELIGKVVQFAMGIYGGRKSEDAKQEQLVTALDPTAEIDSKLVSVEDLDSSALFDAINYAQDLMARFKETGNLEHSNDAVLILESQLEGFPPGHPNRHELLFNLSATLSRRVEIQLSDLKSRSESMLALNRALTRAVLLSRHAISASPATLDVKIQYLSHLSYTCTLWSTLVSAPWPATDVVALVEALDSPDEMCIVTADIDSPERLTGFLAAVIMATTLSTVFPATRNPAYRTAGRTLYRGLLKSAGNLLPLDKMIGSMNFFDPQARVAQLSFITEGFIPFIVQIMALLMQRLVEVPLSAVVGRHAAAIALDMGSKFGMRDIQIKGVEWLEQCLMVVWGQTNLRAPAPVSSPDVNAHARLEQKTERLVLALLGLCLDADLAGDTGTPSVAHPDRVAFLIVKEWFEQLDDARSSPAFVDLFRPRPFHLLTAAAHGGSPVVVLNLWGSQCDALVIRGASDFACVRLEGITEELAAKIQGKLRGALSALGIRSRGDELSDELRADAPVVMSDLQNILAILWNEVVQPVLAELKLEPVEDAELDPPRLIWCPTGPTSFFPLHAAGLYDTDRNGTKTFEFVASSYTPTLSILSEANEALPARSQEPFRGILAVSVSDAGTPNLSKIPQTADEVKALIGAVTTSSAEYVWLRDAEATKAAVLSEMGTKTWVHFACHARQYPLNTSESAFLLAGGATLTLADIAAHAAAGGGGELAFLSACQTAAGDFDLSEEGVHLAAGMLVAGFRSVIATTWSVRDADAPVVAGEVYRRLLKDGQVDRTGAALALHHAVRVLREQVGVERFVQWAPFVHLGV